MKLKETAADQAIPRIEGYGNKTEAAASIREREFPNLSQAATLDRTFSYWISIASTELEPRHMEGKGYSGRTFRGLPKEEGYYSINDDNTFTKLEDKNDAEWGKRLYVSDIAAAKAESGKGTLVILYIMRDAGHFTKLDSALNVFASDTSPENIACVISVPKTDSKELCAAASEAARKEASA